MTEKTTEKTYEITNTVKTYIAEDGKEFSYMDECITYENELFLNHCADKYKIKSISVPTFICDNDHVHGISFYFPQDGDENEVIKLLSIYQNYEISISSDKWKIKWTRNLSNVRDSDFEIKIPFELNKGDNYVFYFCWEEDCDNYDDFYNQIISKEIAMTELEKEIKRFEVIFGTKFENKQITKEHTPEEIKYRLSDLGVQIGNIAINYITELEKENTELKERITFLGDLLFKARDLAKDVMTFYPACIKSVYDKAKEFLES